MSAHASLLATATSTEPSAQRLRLEFPAPVLLRLLAEGRLCAAEFRCLDATSHRLVRELVLRSCIERLQRPANTPISFNHPLKRRYS